MAPTITTAGIISQEHQTLSHKLRKPLVEKLSRERINSSIEQLKSLLDPEFPKQQPDSKMEKADILEMTVCVLTRLPQYQRRLVKRLNKLQSSSEENLTSLFAAPQSRPSIPKDQSPVNSVLWGPW